MENKQQMNSLAMYIDHTNLQPISTSQEIRQLCEEARMYSFRSVCVHSSWVQYCAKLLEHTDVGVCTVVGFPFGANDSVSKAFEARQAVFSGATEIDMVIAIGALIERNDQYVFDDIELVVNAVADQAIVKVIIETSLLTDEQKVKACELAEQAGAHYVKTSTGFASGGATVEDVRLMKRTVSANMGIKASGGIRDKHFAMQLIEAGATRLGMSAGVSIMNAEQQVSPHDSDSEGY